MKQRVVVITGGSGGIGQALARRFAAAGDRVYELSRSGRDAEGVRHLTADVTDAASLQAAVRILLAEVEGVDLLFCNAGYGIAGPVEETPEADWMRQLDTNLGGVIRTVQAFLPVMRKQGRGRIFLTSSLGGVMALPYQCFYSVSKAGINQFCLALRNECRDFGVEVAAILPGDLCTGFTDHRQPVASRAYPRCAASLARMERDERNGASPDTFANLAFRLAGRRRLRPFYTLGAQYVLFHALYRVLPLRFGNWVMGRLYG